jgi:aminoglycoside 6'-N-acetyltransferase I
MPRTHFEVRVLGPNDANILEHVATDVFDHPIAANWTAEFLTDLRHHLVVAVSDGCVVGMASAVHYIHPDKAPQLWINEVGVAPDFRRQGVGSQLIARLVQLATALGCTEAWVLAERANTDAQRFYEQIGAALPPGDCLMYTIPIADSRERP